MEIEIPFSEKRISGNLRLSDLKYRAILSRDSLFYALFDIDDQIVAKEQISVNAIIKHPKRKSPFLFENATIAFNNTIFSFIPDKDYDEKKAVDYLSFCHQLTDIKNYHIHNSYLDQWNTWIVYAIPKPIHKAIYRRLADDVHFLHYQEIFLKNVVQDNHPQALSISLIGNNMNISLHQSQDLIVSNNYAVHNPSEFYYFISLIYDQYGLSKGITRIILDGDLGAIQIEKSRFFQLFGCYPLYRNTTGEISELPETTLNEVPLIHINRCALLQEH